MGRRMNKDHAERKVKEDTECLFCMRKLNKNIESLKSPANKRSSIAEKLTSFVSPTDYENVYDPTLFPDPKICKSCFNLVNGIHRNAIKIENLTGGRLNFQLNCESAINGNPKQKWPDVKQEYKSSGETGNTTTIKQNKESSLRKISEEISQALQIESSRSISHSKVKQECQNNTTVQDSGEETDNYFEADESMTNDAIEDEDCKQRSDQTWSVKTRSSNSKHSPQEPNLSVKLFKSGVITSMQNAVKPNNDDSQNKKSGTSEDIGKHILKKKGKINKSKTGLSEDKKVSVSQKDGQDFDSAVVSPSAMSLNVNGKKSSKKKESSREPKKCSYKKVVSKDVHDNTQGGLPYACTYNDCDRAFRRRASLKRHEASHSPEQPFCCDECGKRFNHVRNFKLHKLSHKKRQERLTQPPLEKTIPCEVCGKMFSSRLNVRRHINLVHKGIKQKRPPDQTFVCEVNGCNRIFRWKSCMVRHVALKHRKEDYKHRGRLVIYSCSVEGCKADFNRRRLLREHMSSVHGKGAECGDPKTFKEWLCFECGLAVTKKQMSRHMDTFHSPGSMFNAEERGTFACMTELCGMTFKSTEVLKAHILSHVGNPPYKCLKEGCKKTFLLKNNLDLHMMVHNNIKPFLCKIDGCGKSFVTQLCLMRHSKEHNGGLYVCPVETCAAKFRNMNNAGGHLAGHRGENPYVCGLCGAVFTTYNVWARHKKRHAGALGKKTHKCPKCERSFTLRCELKRHLPVHSDEKPYRCEICGMGYASKGGYSSHLLTHGEKKYFCTFDGCGKSFTLPLTLKRHQAVHGKSAKLCSSCGKILKFSLRKHKCAAIKEDSVDEETTEAGTANDYLHTPEHQILPLQTPSLPILHQGYQNSAQTFQQQQQQLQQLHETITSHQQQHIVTNHYHHQQQQQLIQQQQQQQQQDIQPLQQHLTTLNPFQPELQQQQQQQQQQSIFPQQLHPLLMSNEMGIPNITPEGSGVGISVSVNSIGSLNNVNNVGSSSSHCININNAVPSIPINSPHPLHPTLPPFAPPLPTISTIPLTPFPMSSMPNTPLPQTSLTFTTLSQSEILPSMPLANTSLTSLALSSSQPPLTTITPIPLSICDPTPTIPLPHYTNNTLTNCMVIYDSSNPNGV